MEIINIKGSFNRAQFLGYFFGAFILTILGFIVIQSFYNYGMSAASFMQIPLLLLFGYSLLCTCIKRTRGMGISLWWLVLIIPFIQLSWLVLSLVPNKK